MVSAMMKVITTRMFVIGMEVIVASQVVVVLLVKQVCLLVVTVVLQIMLRRLNVLYQILLLWVMHIVMFWEDTTQQYVTGMVVTAANRPVSTVRVNAAPTATTAWTQMPNKKSPNSMRSKLGDFNLS